MQSVAAQQKKFFLKQKNVRWRNVASGNELHNFCKKIKKQFKTFFDILCASKGQLLLPMLMWKVRYFYNWTRGGSFCFCLIATRYLILTQSPLSLGFNSFYNFNRINKTATYINWLQMQHSWAFFSDSAVIETNNVLLNEDSAVNWTRDAIAQSTVMTI